MPSTVSVFGFSLGRFAPGFLPVVPINAPIAAEQQVLPYESVRQMIESAKTFQVAECICRKDRALKGTPCKHTLETCLSFSNEEQAFDKYPLGRMISKQEALDLLAKTEEEGLVHQTYNTRIGTLLHLQLLFVLLPDFRRNKEFWSAPPNGQKQFCSCH